MPAEWPATGRCILKEKTRNGRHLQGSDTPQRAKYENKHSVRVTFGLAQSLTRILPMSRSDEPAVVEEHKNAQDAFRKTLVDCP